MQLLGILIMVGILALLLLVAVYLGSTEKTHNKPASSTDDYYHSIGLGNVADANEHIREVLSAGDHQPRSPRKQGKQRTHQHKHNRDDG